jgi:hypothetical protein
MRNECGGGGCLELSKCKLVFGRRTEDGGGGGRGTYNPINRFKESINNVQPLVILLNAV